MAYQLTHEQLDKLASFGIDRPRLAQLVATVTDNYALPPCEAWDFVVVDLVAMTDRDYVKEITKSCRRYGEYLEEMERRGADGLQE